MAKSKKSTTDTPETASTAGAVPDAPAITLGILRALYVNYACPLRQFYNPLRQLRMPSTPIMHAIYVNSITLYVNYACPLRQFYNPLRQLCPHTVCVSMARVVVRVSVCVIVRARVCNTTESFSLIMGVWTHPRPPHMTVSRVHPTLGVTVTVMVVGGVVQI